MPVIKHDPDAFVLAVANGLADCTEDTSAPIVAFLLRAIVSSTSNTSTDAADADDALLLETIVVPTIRKLSADEKDKLVHDLSLHGAMLIALAEAVSDS